MLRKSALQCRAKGTSVCIGSATIRNPLVADFHVSGSPSAQPLKQARRLASTSRSDAVTLAKTSPARSASKSREDIFLGSVLSSDSRTTIQDLLKAIELPERDQDSERHGHIPLLALLLTPSFARTTNLSQLPLHVLRRLSSVDASSISSLDAIVGVVDRLPDPSNQQQGSEGLAYLYMPRPTEQFVPSQTALQPSAQKPGSLKFELSNGSSATTIQLPLAHTIFTTGLPSTLVRARYDVKTGSSQLKLSFEKQIESQIIPLPLGLRGSFTYETPLVPLTPARPVASAMGNIVRKLLPLSWPTAMQLAQLAEPPKQPRDLLAASEELEVAVSQYFESLNLQPTAVQVWALIVPSLKTGEEIMGQGAAGALLALDKDAIKSLWIEIGDQTKSTAASISARAAPSAIFKLLGKGARLCKVLSGGGGWGKKAGLVSLDPDLEYSTRELRGDTGWDFAFSDEDSDLAVLKQQREALGDMINEGDSLMFFLAPQTAELVGEKVRAQDQASDSATVKVEKSSRLIRFGPIPSSIDEVQTQQPAKDGAGSQQAPATHYPDVFGVLSEGGMAFHRTSDEIWGTLGTKSKLDVPFSTLTIRSESSTSD